MSCEHTHLFLGYNSSVLSSGKEQFPTISKFSNTSPVVFSDSDLSSVVFTAIFAPMLALYIFDGLDQ